MLIKDMKQVSTLHFENVEMGEMEKLSLEKLSSSQTLEAATLPLVRGRRQRERPLPLVHKQQEEEVDATPSLL